MKIKKSEIMSLYILIFLLAGNIIGLVFSLNMKKIFGIGHHNVNLSEEIEYLNGKGIIEADLDISFIGDMDNPLPDHSSFFKTSHYFRITISFNILSSGDVKVIGLTYINYTLFYNSLDVIFKSMNQKVNNIKFFRETIYRQFTKNDMLILLGSLNTQFLVGEEIKNEIITFELIHIQKIDPGEYVYSYDIPIIWLNAFLFTTLTVLIVIVNRRIKFIRLWQKYTEEDFKSDENYHQYIKKLTEEQKTEDHKKDQ